jgi:hypothetical protein
LSGERGDEKKVVICSNVLYMCVYIKKTVHTYRQTERKRREEKEIHGGKGGRMNE